MRLFCSLCPDPNSGRIKDSAKLVFLLQCIIIGNSAHLVDHTHGIGTEHHGRRSHLWSQESRFSTAFKRLVTSRLKSISFFLRNSTNPSASHEKACRKTGMLKCFQPNIAFFCKFIAQKPPEWGSPSDYQGAFFKMRNSE